ncbi:ABC transporter substrate-binding protein [Paenibacillus sp. HB172176]|uniref:ABC transporter substrate-binding protein n=1 Tax=Paenibacillus sp. HB172176 TaxID=2493690 RepID=UPI0014393CFA|nr:ABC transporter substrate-binding protein [Paenibacillus sp. HB172176]
MKYRAILLSLILFTLALAGCVNANEKNQPQSSAASIEASPTASTSASPAPSETSNGMRTVVDELGHEIRIPEHPERILAPYLEDPLTTLGIMPVAQWANGDIVQEYLQDRIGDLPKVDFSAGGLDPEQAAQQAPDLIILTMAVWAEKGMYEAYSKIAPTYVLNNGIQDWKKTLQTLGELLDRSEQANQTIADYEAKVEEAKQRLASTMGDEQVALLWPTGNSLYLLSELDYSGQLLYGDLGLNEPELAMGQSFQNLSLEKLPDVGNGRIFLITGYNDTEIEELESSPVWKSLPAVKNNRITNVSWNHWMNNGPLAKQLNLEDTLNALLPE